MKMISRMHWGAESIRNQRVMILAYSNCEKKFVKEKNAAFYVFSENSAQV